MQNCVYSSRCVYSKWYLFQPYLCIIQQMYECAHAKNEKITPDFVGHLFFETTHTILNVHTCVRCEVSIINIDICINYPHASIIFVTKAAKQAHKIH